MRFSLSIHFIYNVRTRYYMHLNSVFNTVCHLLSCSEEKTETDKGNGKRGRGKGNLRLEELLWGSVRLPEIRYRPQDLPLHLI